MKELVTIQSKLRANKTLRNDFGGFNYRSAESILATLKPLLAELNCQLIMTDDIVQVGERYYVKATATITNANGEKEQAQAFARECPSRPKMDDAQVTGAASSYARKYALNGLFAIDDTKDPDSNEYTKKRVESEQAQADELQNAIREMNAATTFDAANAVWQKYEQYHNDAFFIDASKQARARTRGTATK